MGKILKENLEPNSVYAVQFTDSKSRKYRGIVMTNAKSRIWRSWNIIESNQWMEQEVTLTSSHNIYPATEMEQQFAYNTLTAQSVRAHCQTLLNTLRRMKRELHYYRTDKWHNVAEKVNKTFNGGGYRDEEE